MASEYQGEVGGRISEGHRAAPLAMPNAPISGRANGTQKEHKNCAARAPLYWVVRQRVLQNAAAPPSRAFRNRAES